MVIQFNVNGEDRKAMVKAIEDELGVKATCTATTLSVN